MVVECIYSQSLRVRGIVWVLLMLLMLMVEVNCILGLLISINITTDPIINQYPQTIASLVVVNMLYNIVTLFMEILLIGKYPAYYFPSWLYCILLSYISLFWNQVFVNIDALLVIFSHQFAFLYRFISVVAAFDNFSINIPTSLS